MQGFEFSAVGSSGPGPSKSGSVLFGINKGVAQNELFGIRAVRIDRCSSSMISLFDRIYKTKSVEPQFSNIIITILVNLVSDKRLLGFRGLVNMEMNLYYLCCSQHVPPALKKHFTLLLITHFVNTVYFQSTSRYQNDDRKSFQDS